MILKFLFEYQTSTFNNPLIYSFFSCKNIYRAEKIHLLKNLQFFLKIKVNLVFFTKKNFIFNFFFEFFFNNYFSTSLHKLSYFKICNLPLKLNLKKKKLFNVLKHTKKMISKFKLQQNAINSMVRVFLILLIFKDVKIFLSWVKQLCESTNLKLHRQFFSFLRITLLFFFNNYKKYIRVSGYFLQIKGKISGAGSFKKKKNTFKNGMYSLNNNKLRVSYDRTTARTYSGVLGIFFFLTF